MSRIRTSLRPPHLSVVGQRRTPINMHRLPVSHDQAAALTEMTLEIFADVCNSGRTFQEALTALYLSGLQHGMELSRREE
jgi:hypothetical protein